LKSYQSVQILLPGLFLAVSKGQTIKKGLLDGNHFPLIASLAPLFGALLTKVVGRSMGEWSARSARSARSGIAALAVSLFGSLATLILVVCGPAIHVAILPVGRVAAEPEARGSMLREPGLT
jgi:hypothetical protein